VQAKMQVELAKVELEMMRLQIECGARHGV